MATSLQRAMWEDQDERYGSPDDIQGWLDKAADFEAQYGTQPSAWERLRQIENTINNVTPVPPADYKKPAGPNPTVPSWKQDQFLLADTGTMNTNAITERLHNMGVIDVMSESWLNRSAARDKNQAYLKTAAGATELGTLAEDAMLDATMNQQDTQKTMHGLLSILKPEVSGLGSTEDVAASIARSIGVSNKEAYLAKALSNATAENAIGLLAERFAPVFHELDEDKFGIQ